MADKVIITAALSGSVTKKEHNPNVPYTPEEFAREARRVEEAGAAVAHIHFRDYDTGEPTTDPTVMADVVAAIRENSGLLLNLSTGVSLESTLEERKRPIVHHRPELASLNPGTMNFCTVSYRDGRIIADKTYYNPLEGTIEFGTQMHRQGIKPELECFALSHVHNALFFFEHYDLHPEPVFWRNAERSHLFGGLNHQPECLKRNIFVSTDTVRRVPDGLKEAPQARKAKHFSFTAACSAIC